MKKIFVCVLAAAMVLTCCAFADDEPEVTPDVLDTEETIEPSPTPSESPTPTDTPSPTPSPSVDDGGGDLRTPRPIITIGGVVPSLFDDESEEANATPDPDAEVMSFEEETLHTLGGIYSLLVFFTVILVAFLVWKFLRIFF